MSNLCFFMFVPLLLPGPSRRVKCTSKHKCLQFLCLQMNYLESLKYDETSVKSVAGPRSPESNVPNVREALLEETNPKRLYERAPPEGSEIRHDISYHPVYDNKPSKAEKVMKDKDLSVSFQEGKKDNIVQSLNYASECSLHNFDIRFKLAALSKYTCIMEQ